MTNARRAAVITLGLSVLVVGIITLVNRDDAPADVAAQGGGAGFLAPHAGSFSPCPFLSSELVDIPAAGLTGAAGGVVSFTERVTNTSGSDCGLETHRCGGSNRLMDSDGTPIDTGPVYCTSQSEPRRLGPGDSHVFVTSIDATVPPGVYTAEIHQADGTKEQLTLTLDDRTPPCLSSSVSVGPNGQPSLRDDPIAGATVSVLINVVSTDECTIRIAETSLLDNGSVVGSSNLGRWFVTSSGGLISADLSLGKLDNAPGSIPTLELIFDNGDVSSTPLPEPAG